MALTSLSQVPPELLAMFGNGAVPPPPAVTGMPLNGRRGVTLPQVQNPGPLPNNPTGATPPIRMGAGGVNLDAEPTAPVPPASAFNMRGSVFGGPRSSDDPGITGMPALPTPPDVSKSPVGLANTQYQADVAKRAAFGPAPNPQDYKPRWTERLKGGLLGGLVGGLSRNAEEGGNFGASLTNSRFNQAESSYRRGTSALDKQLEAERGGFPIAEAAGKLPQEDFTNKLNVAKEQREQSSTLSNEEYKSNIADIRNTIAQGNIEKAQNQLDQQQKVLDEKKEHDKDWYEMQHKMLDLRQQIEQNKANKPNSSAVGIESKKAAALSKAKRQYDQDTEKAGNDPELRKQADQNFKDAQQEAQDAYEAEVSAAGGSPTHSDWPTEKPGTKASPTKVSQMNGHKVNDVVTLKGKPVKITAIYSNGQFDYQPVQ